MSAAFSLRRFRAMLLKESLQILRDPSTFLIAFVLPMIMLFFFGYAISLDPTRTRIGLALQDSSAPALSLAQAYENSRWFDVSGARRRRDSEASWSPPHPRHRGHSADFSRQLQIPAAAPRSR
jgi:ABC-2 type transport system permease protein